MRPQVLLVQIAVPSRTDVPEYQKLRSMVHEIVGRINGTFGTLTYVPIYHLDTSLSFTELCALYAVTDVALITSLVRAWGARVLARVWRDAQLHRALRAVRRDGRGAHRQPGARAPCMWASVGLPRVAPPMLCTLCALPRLRRPPPVWGAPEEGGGRGMWVARKARF